jgi:periplasmic divalent cation tolerance protein
MGEHAVILSTASSEDEARRIASALVERRLAACVNVLPKIHSTYRWNDAVERAEEWMLVVKTRRERFEEVARTIRELHSYELPEVVMLDLAGGDPRYLAWIDACL